MNNTKQLTRFLIVAVVLYLAWFLLYEIWLGPLGEPDQYLTRHTAHTAAMFMQFMGFDIHISHASHMSILSLGSQQLLGVAHECNALVLFVLFSGFIIAFPGRFLHKAAYILAGSVLIWFINVWRVAMLTLIQIHSPSALDFNHKYTFTILVYGFIFGLWMLWVKKITPMGLAKEKEPVRAFDEPWLKNI
jgi:exosortase family protein XrtF